MRGIRWVGAILAVGAVLAPAALAAPPPPLAHGQGDAGGFHDVLPPGTNGFDNALELLQFESTGARPAHNQDQLGMYRDLLYASPGLRAANLTRYYKDSRFGAALAGAGQPYHPGGRDVTVVRDRYGVPHIRGATRADTMYAIGYVTAEDRLFFIDVLRHVGRAELSSFAGGASANRLLDREIWQTAPYTEADLQRQVDQSPPGFAKPAAKLRADLHAYVDGINGYIAEARLDPSKMPAEYAAIDQPLGPTDWKATDTVAVATLVGAIFGAGGGSELPSALALEDARHRYGKRAGTRVWQDFREANDPEAPTTVRGRAFPYEPTPRHAHGVALPDPGSLRDYVNLDASTTNTKVSGPVKTPFPLGTLAFPGGMSNALLISARLSASGHPLAVFGPQVAYFAPEILMEQDVHGPGLAARGAAFPGANLYVSLGHGRDYAWSATSAGQDLTDTFGVPLCEPGGKKPSIDSMHYLFRGRCVAIEVLKRTDSWKPNAADQTPPGTETYTVQRTALGIVTARSCGSRKAGKRCLRRKRASSGTRMRARTGASNTRRRRRPLRW